jgi:3-dehydroquinate synthase
LIALSLKNLEAVIFSSDLIHDLRTTLRKINFSKLGVITDSNTIKYCYPLIKEALPEDHLVYDFPAGEINKNLRTCEGIWHWMTDAVMDRNTLIVNLGGGVVGDMGGFCASTYKRGVKFINLPTTLLSQVDASVGGKLGIDFNGFKNHIGVFNEPEQVMISSHFLKTLPHQELRSGYAEVIKHSLIYDFSYFNTLKEVQDWENQAWDKIIEHSVGIKKEVVTKDPKEAGLRKILNFGHTIGHAIETYYLDTEKHLLHGEAIAAGMIMEAFLSHKNCGLNEHQLSQLIQLILQIYGKVEIPANHHPSIIALCAQDKKNEGHQINFSLLTEIGQCTYNVLITIDEINEALQFYNQLTV